jgi:hemerythrin-like domain-containing protein
LVAKTTRQPHFDGREMVIVHDMLRREFALMPGLVGGVAVGDPDRAQTIGDHIETMITVLHHHHFSEDEHVWPLLRDRCAQSVAALVELTEDQHEQIAALADAVDKALSIWRDGVTLESRKALVDALDQLITPLKEHLSNEEDRLVPLTSRQPSGTKWSPGERPSPIRKNSRSGSGC